MFFVAWFRSHFAWLLSFVKHNFGAFYYRFGSGESTCTTFLWLLLTNIYVRKRHFFTHLCCHAGAADVFDRMSTFLDSLWRSFDMNQSQYFVLVTHGISIRVLLSRYFRYTVDQFHLLSNPRNCEMVELEHDGKGRLRMAGRHELEECPVSDQSTQHGVDETQEQEPEETSRPQQQQHQQRRTLRYRYHERLRVLPPEFVRTTHIRISPDDSLKKKPTIV
jgi:Histidine phosphatase superfamily (branch 1)